MARFIFCCWTHTSNSCLPHIFIQSASAPIVFALIRGTRKQIVCDNSFFSLSVAFLSALISYLIYIIIYIIIYINTFDWLLLWFMFIKLHYWTPSQHFHHWSSGRIFRFLIFRFSKFPCFLLTLSVLKNETVTTRLGPGAWLCGTFWIFMQLHFLSVYSSVLAVLGLGVG